MGSLSSWYALSAMGLYAVTPGDPVYAIGSPSFGKTTIQVGDGKTFIIKANNHSKENVYIQSATLNGQPFDKTRITHQEMINGGELCFELGSKPNPNWGTLK
jgi:putative alpha-1,2-mannosidase